MVGSKSQEKNPSSGASGISEVDAQVALSRTQRSPAFLTKVAAMPLLNETMRNIGNRGNMKSHLSRSIAISLTLLASALALSACGSDTNPISAFKPDSATVSLVKDGSVGACPSSTLGEMANAFLTNPEWNDFTTSSGESVVELTGSFLYSGSPATLSLQFSPNLATSSFEVGYMGINDVSQSRIVVAALFDKMCAAT